MAQQRLQPAAPAERIFGEAKEPRKDNNAAGNFRDQAQTRRDCRPPFVTQNPKSQSKQDEADCGGKRDPLRSRYPAPESSNPECPSKQRRNPNTCGKQTGDRREVSQTSHQPRIRIRPHGAWLSLPISNRATRDTESIKSPRLQNMREYPSRIVIVDVTWHTSGNFNGYQNDYSIPKMGILLGETGFRPSKALT
jgi:hypothetical protein